jgi:ATP-dependent NAD(P)H-hydrate dehydratase
MASLASQSRKELLSKARQLVPPMLDSFHKGKFPNAFTYQTNLKTGQLGRVAVIGGSEDYTGAPYFSAMASAKLGCDMVRYA